MNFAARLLAWFALRGRKDLPWQREPTAYRVWVSEVMLQQTQVATVTGYFERFMQRFPNLPALAAAPLEDVLAHWAGLGYYARGRNLHRAAQAVVAAGGLDLPQGRASLEALPGIGRSTAAAISALARKEGATILDGNVKRVLARHAGIKGWPGTTAVNAALWAVAEGHTPATQVAEYTQAIMDLGALICTPRKPHCGDCPVALDCVARLSDRVAELPTPRPKKSLPERQTWMLLLQDHSGAYWLEQRPPVGIWGGLYCLPEYPSEAALRASLGHAGSGDAVCVLPTLRHDFSHFRLHITPVLAREPPAQAQGVLMEAGDGLWYKPGAGQDRPALPAPIARLLGLHTDRGLSG